MYKVIAMDLDGTLTQHKTPLCAEHRDVLTKPSQKSENAAIKRTSQSFDWLVLFWLII